MKAASVCRRLPVSHGGTLGGSCPHVLVCSAGAQEEGGSGVGGCGAAYASKSI